MENNIFKSRLLSLTRRYAYIWHDGQVKQGRFLSRDHDFIIGDVVDCFFEKGELLVVSFEQRKNILSRVYFGKKRNIASNIDRVFIVTAPNPLFNTNFIDNVLCATKKEGIHASLIVNKSDLDIENINSFVKAYKALNIDIMFTNTVAEDGVDNLKKYFDNAEETQVLLCGISGVGKSSILNKLIPDMQSKVGELGKRGQGTQTTTQAFGAFYERKKESPLFIIDLPGIQNFNVSFLDKYEISVLFDDIKIFSKKCEYDDCLHTVEPNCAVKNAVKEGKISSSRYESYLKILDDIQREKKF